MPNTNTAARTRTPIQGVLLAHIVDHAGIFPPAEMSLADAVADYRRHRDGPHGWMLGPFLVATSRVDTEALSAVDGGIGIVDDRPANPLPVGVVPAQVELRADPTPADVIEAVERRRAAVTYVESSAGSPVPIVEAVAVARAETGADIRAKIRTGGGTVDSFPDVDKTAAFIVTAVASEVPFKATAGLHHPFRHQSTVVEGATEHGFVNVLAATRAALAGSTERQVSQILAATEPDEFDLVDMSWRGIGVAVDAAAVRRAFRSFGSCSFAEPTAYLIDLGVVTGGDR